MKCKIMLWAVGWLFMSFTGIIYASEIEARSRIAKVTLYPDSALVSRQAGLKLNPGRQRIVFADIIPEVDEDSLRASFQGNAQVKLFGARLRKEFLREDPSERIKELESQIKELEDQKKKTEYDKEILNKEKQFLDSVRLFSEAQLPKDLVTKIPQPQELEGLMKFLDAKWKENYSGYIDCEFKVREIVNKIDVLRRELSQMSGPRQKLKRSIEVDLEVIKDGGGELALSYLVRGGSWQPVYEARADFEKSEVELVSNAIVKQNTGEDWQDVEMVLSTAKPLAGGNMPYVSPWLIRPYQPPMEYAKERKISNMKVEMSAALQFAAFDSEMDKDGAAGMTVSYSQAEEKGVAVTYALNEKASVKSDGSEHKLSVSSQALAARFEYSACPRAISSAYLGSRVVNAPDLQLLAGRVNVFLGGDFTGTANIPGVGPAEEFDLYLGADENVKIKREQIERKVDETLIGNITSSTKRTVFKYKLTVENYKSKKIPVKLFEAIPVSEDDRIKIKMGQVSLEPKQKDWQDRKGVWLWELELEPRAKQEVMYSYTIEHPRDMRVEGL